MEEHVVSVGEVLNKEPIGEEGVGHRLHKLFELLLVQIAASAVSNSYRYNLIVHNHSIGTMV